MNGTGMEGDEIQAKDAVETVLLSNAVEPNTTDTAESNSNTILLSTAVEPNATDTAESNNKTESIDTSTKNLNIKVNSNKSNEAAKSYKTADSNVITEFNTAQTDINNPRNLAKFDNLIDNDSSDTNNTELYNSTGNIDTEPEINTVTISTTSNIRSECETAIYAPEDTKVDIKIDINEEPIDEIKNEDDVKTEPLSSSAIREFQLNLRPRRAEKRRYADLSEDNIEMNAELEFKQRLKELKVRDRTGQGFKPPIKHKMKIQTDGPPYLCNLCPFKTDQKVAYSNHIRYHQKKDCTKFICPHCNGKFKTNNELRSHKATHNSDQTFMCQKCQEAFSNHLDYAIHNTIHSRPPFKCNECSLKFPQRSNLALHLPSHVIQEKIQCKLCSSKIVAKKFKAHVQRHKSMVTHECVECGKTYQLKKDLATHMSVHTGVRKYQCWYCGRCCLSSQSRNNHLKVHSNERPFSCGVCGKAFKQDTYRITHEEGHNKTKEFECDTCHKRFKRKTCLVMHMRMHLNYKPYSCADCDERFCTLPSYKNHMARVHIGKKEFSCEVCSASFYTVSELQKHFRTNIHKNKLYSVNKLAEN